MRGSQNGLSQDISQQPRQTRVRRGPLRPQEPVTSQVTTAPCRGSRGQTSSDGPVASVFANPTRRDLAGRSHYPLHGDGQRPNAGVSGCRQHVESDYRRPERTGHWYVTLCLLPDGAASSMVSHLILEP